MDSARAVGAVVSDGLECRSPHVVVDVCRKLQRQLAEKRGDARPVVLAAVRTVAQAKVAALPRLVVGEFRITLGTCEVTVTLGEDGKHRVRSQYGAMGFDATRKARVPAFVTDGERTYDTYQVLAMCDALAAYPIHAWGICPTGGADAPRGASLDASSKVLDASSKVLRALSTTLFGDPARAPPLRVVKYHDATWVSDAILCDAILSVVDDP
jgi:hypothetical protein